MLKNIYTSIRNLRKNIKMIFVRKEIARNCTLIGASHGFRLGSRVHLGHGSTPNDVILHDGTSLEFSHNGQWTKVDCGLNPLPVGVLPANIAQYVSANFPANYATKIKYDDRRYEVDMNNNLELRFDKNGMFIGADD